MKAFVIFGLIGVLISCNDLPQFEPDLNNRSYSDSLIQWRRLRDKELKTNPKTPIPHKHLESFTGLEYFSPDSQWIFKAHIKPTNNTEIIDISTTTQRVIKMIPFGFVHFTIHNQDFVLTAFQDLKDPTGALFIPFTDLTNGTTSYGGGRYLDIAIPKTDTLTLDFNLAYNPYCVYNHSYSCPIPPEENFIDIEITAGEKVLTF